MRSCSCKSIMNLIQTICIFTLQNFQYVRTYFLPGITSGDYTPICPSGWTSFKGAKMCYKNLKGDGQGDFDFANATCFALGADVVMPRTKEENDYIKQVMSSNGMSDVHIALSDYETDYKWRWGDGTLLQPNDFSDFAPDEPNKFYRNEHCVALQDKTPFSPNIYWNDIRCNYRTYVVCQKIAPQRACPGNSKRSPSSSTCYYSPGIYTYDDGGNECKKLGMELPKPKTQYLDELLAHAQMLNEFKEIFIGLKQGSLSEGWKWEDGEMLGSEYTNWGFGSLANIHCGFKAQRNNYKWYSKTCDIVTMIVCQCYLPIDGYVYTNEMICPADLKLPNLTTTQSAPTEDTSVDTNVASTSAILLDHTTPGAISENISSVSVTNSVLAASQTVTAEDDLSSGQPQTTTFSTSTYSSSVPNQHISTNTIMTAITLPDDNLTTYTCPACLCNSSFWYRQYLNYTTLPKSGKAYPLTHAELREYRKTLTLSQMKLTSATDDRDSARYIGYCGVIILCVLILLLIGLDFAPAK